MNRVFRFIAGFLAMIPVSTAQISGGGVTGGQSIPGLLSELLGINMGEPYQAIGFAATFGLMWISAYIIFKVGIKKLDEGLDTGGRRSGGFASAVGIDSEDSRNLLAVLTLLITLSIIGTGAFAGLIRGWQSLILLAFTFMLIAGLAFIIIGGTGGILGGGSYMAGKSAKATAQGVREAAEEIESIRSEEERVEDVEGDIEAEESDAGDRERSIDDSGGSGGGSGSGSGERGDSGSEEAAEREIEDVTRKLERAIQLINDIEDKLDDSISTEIENLKNDLRDLKRSLELLGLTDESEELQVLKRILSRSDLSRDEVEELLSIEHDPGDAETEFKRVLEKHDPYLISEEEAEILSDYFTELEGIKGKLDRVETNIALYRELQKLLEHLEDEFEHAKDEEKYLEKLISNLDAARSNEELLDQVKQEKSQLDTLREKLGKIEELDNKLVELENHIQTVEDKIGDIEKLRQASDVRKVLVGELQSYCRKDVSSAKFIGFSGSDKPVMEPGLTILPAGRDDTTLKVDMDMSAGTHTPKKPFEFYPRSRSIVNRFEGEIKSYIRSTGIKGKGDVPEATMNLFSNLNNELSSLSGASGSKSIVLSDAFDSLRFDSNLVNAVYLGFLFHNFREIYDNRVVESGVPDSHIGAWRPVRDFLDDVFVSLGSYRTGSGVFPCVFVDSDSLGVCYCPATGETFTDIEPERIQETRYIF